MAISAKTQWEIRATGGAFAGGGFDASYGGTDFTQQDSPQLTITDGTTNTGNATLSSVTGGFTAAMVGNVVGIVEAASFKGFWQIVAYTNTNTVTLDRNGPVTASDCTVRVGGGLLFAQSGIAPKAVNGSSAVQGGQKFWVKAGTYTLSSNEMDTGAISGAASNPITIEGYTTTRGDGAPTRPLFQRGGGSISLLRLSANFWIIKNLQLVASTVDVPLAIDGNNNHVENCQITGGPAGDALTLGGIGNRVRRNDIRTSTSSGGSGVNLTGTAAELSYNLIDGPPISSGNGVAVSGTGFIHHNIITNFVLTGIRITGSGVAFIANNIIWGCHIDGINIFTDLCRAVILNNIIGKNTQYDVYYASEDAGTTSGGPEWAAVSMHCNQFYTTGSARVFGLPTTDDHTTLTANPFTDSDNLNFSLNSTAGGGAVVRATTCTTSFADGINSSVQYAGIAGCPSATASASSQAATLRDLWRELTGEKDTTVVPDSAVDDYLQAGLEALNRRVGYHLTTDTTTIALVDGTEEYSLPTDCVEVVFVEHNGQLIDKADIQEWRKQGINWRAGATGVSAEWAMYANKLVLNPRPSAAMVAAGSAGTIRYISTPPAIASGGAEQLGTQDYRPVVYYAVAEWSRSYPDSAFATKRADDYQAKFEAEAQLIAKNYADRGVQR